MKMRFGVFSFDGTPEEIALFMIELERLQNENKIRHDVDKLMTGLWNAIIAERNKQE